MIITEKTINDLPKSELTKLVMKLSTNPFCEHTIQAFIIDYQNRSLSELEKLTLEAEQAVKDFERELLVKYGASQIEEIVMSIDDRYKYISLIKKHTECLDRESEEYDRCRGLIK